jgi:hypothetical protein
VWRWGGAGRVIGADIAKGTGEGATGAIFRHLVGRPRQNARDGTRSSPGDDVFGSASCFNHLCVRGRHVDFYGIADIECGGDAI